ncbi:MAG: hypothetical protein V1875_10340 [Candidatus Altiarchaeota archaeon]
MRFGLLFAIAIVLSQAVSAWGPVTSRHVCTESVRFVWGEGAITECLNGVDKDTLDELCASTYNVLGQEAEASCRAAMADGKDIDPSTASSGVFKDAENHYDFSHCPLSGTAKAWICGDGSRPAYDVALKWFDEAKTASGLCSRIYSFCIGASYYADSESSLNSLKYGQSCVKDIEDSVDRSIAAGTADWSANVLCNFNNGERGLGNLFYKQRIGESSSTLNRAIANITARGFELKDVPYTPKKGVIVLANSIDSKAAYILVDYLKANGVKAVPSDSTDFERLKYNTRIVIVGGQNSPEGVGQAAASVLSQEQEEALLAPSAMYVFETSGIWAQNQKVVIIAGNEAADTEQASNEYRQKVLEAVK